MVIGFAFMYCSSVSYCKKYLFVHAFKCIVCYASSRFLLLMLFIELEVSPKVVFFEPVISHLLMMQS